MSKLNISGDPYFYAQQYDILQFGYSQGRLTSDLKIQKSCSRNGKQLQIPINQTSQMINSEYTQEVWISYSLLIV